MPERLLILWSVWSYPPSVDSNVALFVIVSNTNANRIRILITCVAQNWTLVLVAKPPILYSVALSYKYSFVHIFLQMVMQFICYTWFSVVTIYKFYRRNRVPIYLMKIIEISFYGRYENNIIDHVPLIQFSHWSLIKF